ncbi:MAG: magnesium/cobalt transporter CorA [Myxococcales bacterium]|nr:magnesium/cobalt transporter CorA [Myxococcales bacterium]
MNKTKTMGVQKKARLARKRTNRPGTPPGWLTEQPGSVPSRANCIAFDESGVFEQEFGNAHEIETIRQGKRNVWVNVDGLGDIELLRSIGDVFQLHPLALEDVVHVHQRPKLETYGDMIFFVARKPIGTETSETEQIGMFLGANFVVTFQEHPADDALEHVRNRIRKNAPRMLESTPDYLAYAVLDSIVDSYFPVLEVFGERLEELEDEVLTCVTDKTLSKIHLVKRDLLNLRRSVWPQRDALNAVIRDPSPFIKEETKVFLRDCYDHTIQIIDLVETYREIASGLIEVYLSTLSNRMNDVMRLLTVVSTIFIPLTFIVGLYGMNFDTTFPLNMPELKWQYGYPAVLLAMSVVGIGLWTLFRRRGWTNASVGSNMTETGTKNHAKHPQ